MSCFITQDVKIAILMHLFALLFLPFLCSSMDLAAQNLFRFPLSQKHKICNAQRALSNAMLREGVGEGEKRELMSI